MVWQSFDRKELIDFRMGLTPWCALYVIQIGIFKMDKKESGLFVCFGFLLYSFFKKLDDNCFTVFCWFLLYSNVNQL